MSVSTRISNAVQAVLLVFLVGGSIGANAQNLRAAAPPASIPTFSTEDIARTGFFYAGGHYEGDPGKETMHGAMYVEVLVPKRIRHPYPLVFLHDKGSNGTVWMQTPDGRSGWAYYFLKQGYVVYIEDAPARGRSAYVPELDGKLGIRTAAHMGEKFTDPAKMHHPLINRFTQWPSDAPNKGKMGDPVFDAFAKSQTFYLEENDLWHKLWADANVALLDQLGTPVIMISHSVGSLAAFQTGDARPKLVKAIVITSASGPPIQEIDPNTQEYTDEKHLPFGVSNSPVQYDPAISDPSELNVELQSKADEPGIARCYLQKEPAHKLINLQEIPVLVVSPEASQHRTFDLCDAKWLTQAGVKATYVKLEDVGLAGNGHELMLEKNSDAIAGFLDKWMEKNAR
jgi:pimeloyl-ACP methyl ester carboxylesterase